MNEHAGPACALSGLIVGVFAVLLHDKNPPTPVRLSPAREVSPAPPRGGSSTNPETPVAIRPNRLVEVAASPKPAENAPADRPAIALREIEPADPPRPASPEPSPATEAAARPERSDSTGRPSKPMAPPTPRSSYAIAGTGESLADVAARVYGSRDAAEALWKANRDQVERVDSPLARGTLLRTP